MDRRVPTAWTRLKAVQGETEPGNDGSPASNPSIGSPFLASTSPEDLLRKCLFAWAEILSRKGAPKLRIVLLVPQPFHGVIF